MTFLGQKKQKKVLTTEMQIGEWAELILVRVCTIQLCYERPGSQSQLPACP